MNELFEDVPALSEEASAFLKRHAHTGEPSSESLARLKSRLPPFAGSRVPAWLAIAAGLVLLGAAALALHSLENERVEPGVPVVTPPATSVAATPSPEPPVPEMTLVEEASTASPIAGDLVAVDDLRRVYLQAYSLKGSNPAAARRLFQRIVDETDPRDELHEKATIQLAELRGAGPSAPPAKNPNDELSDLYMRAYQIKDASPLEAAELFKRIIQKTKPGTDLHRKARARLDELDARRVDPNDFLDDTL